MFFAIVKILKEKSTDSLLSNYGNIKKCQLTFGF